MHRAPPHRPRTASRRLVVLGLGSALVALTGCSGAAPVDEVLSPLEGFPPPPGWVHADPVAQGLEEGDYTRTGDVVVTAETDQRALVGYDSDRLTPEALPDECEAAAAWVRDAAELLGDPDLTAASESDQSLDALVETCSASGSDGGGVFVHGIGGPAWTYRGRDVAVYVEVESTGGYTPTPYLVRAFISAE